METSTEVVKELNSLLRGEVAAVETYKEALGKLPQTKFRPQLEECERSHEQRAQALKGQIQKLGGEPQVSGGAWTTFTKLVEKGAASLGEKSAISALEEGEDVGKRDYSKVNLDALDGESRSLVKERLEPEQLRTHQTISELKKLLH